MTQQPSLREEMKESIRNYPKTWKEYAKTLGPALGIGAVGSAVGQTLASHLGYDSNLAMTTSAYVCGYIPGYSYYLSSHYLKNKESYPNGILSEEFGEFFVSFMAADYISDITFFTPTFISSNVWMSNNTEIHPFLRSITAWGSGSLLYLTAMAGLHPVTRRVTQGINNKLKPLITKLKRKR